MGKSFEVLTLPNASTLQKTLDLRKHWCGLKIESHVVQGFDQILVLSWKAHPDGTPCIIGETVEECSSNK